MKILVVSDSHHRTSALFDIIEAHPEIKHIIFLGDGEDDLDDVKCVYTDRSYYSVSGNCDFSGNAPTRLIINLGGKVIFACHGHQYGVGDGYGALITAAKEAGADIALYGHTHIAMDTYCDGIYIMNPGSVGSPRDSGKPSCGIIEISPQGIMMSIVR